MRGDRASVARRPQPKGNRIVIKGRFCNWMTKEASRDAHTHKQQDNNVGTKVMFESASQLYIDIRTTVDKSYWTEGHKSSFIFM